MRNIAHEVKTTPKQACCADWDGTLTHHDLLLVKLVSFHRIQSIVWFNAMCERHQGCGAIVNQIHALGKEFLG